MANEIEAVEASVTALSRWVWEEKYRFTDEHGVSTENTISDTHRRVIEGVFKNDKNKLKKENTFKLMNEFIWCPAGRIHAGAGLDKKVTLINCYVSPTIQDSMATIPDLPGKGILESLNVGAITQQMGGGIGMDFSTLRPDGAIVRRTHSVSTGPLPFMNMWDAMCATVKSSGSRRGAMMGMLGIWHPDILKLIHAKKVKGVLTNFNISVLVPDKFMHALYNGLDWDLYFNVPRADGNHVGTFVDENGELQYIYYRMKASDLWNEITKTTFEYAEPGIQFIDRINQRNNLWYCEKISASNPCGEQPLPPDGACNLGANNLARLVSNPFTDDAAFRLKKFKAAVHIGVRFLDNVLDVTQFPTPEQAKEARQKRRIGLGVTGLGNMLQMMKLRYGSKESLHLIEEVMKTSRDEAYRASIELAKERGPFPLFVKDKFLSGEFVKELPEDIRDGIAQYGIRNGVLLTIAPTGTTSIYYGNVSSGLEPTVAWSFKRKAREADGSYSEFKEVSDYGFEKFKEVTGWKKGDEWPDYMVSSLQAPFVTVDEHLSVQAVCQKYIDSSISKTINCPPDIDFESFKDVYTKAYDYGLKGCTTYKPSAVRGSVISVDEVKKEEIPMTGIVEVIPRPQMLEGSTYKIRYPGVAQAFYVTINDFVDANGKRHPFEMFVNSKSVKHQEWIVALTRMISAIFRRGGDVTFIIEELQQVFSSQGGAFVNQKFVPSLVALIGNTIEAHFKKIGLLSPVEQIVEVPEKTSTFEATEVQGEICPNCELPTLFRIEGCAKCTSCSYSECG